MPHHCLPLMTIYRVSCRNLKCAEILSASSVRFRSCMRSPRFISVFSQPMARPCCLKSRSMPRAKCNPFRFSPISLVPSGGLPGGLVARLRSCLLWPICWPSCERQPRRVQQAKSGASCLWQKQPWQCDRGVSRVRQCMKSCMKVRRLISACCRYNGAGRESPRHS
ncbi:hypothetical protein D9M69_597000 [compost metagenome]